MSNSSNIKKNPHLTLTLNHTLTLTLTHTLTLTLNAIMMVL
jgi:hypothetical protein